jgi:ribonucleotide reductase alpha subunit
MNFSLKKLDISKKVYDIQVKNNPTFTVGRSKLVVHNCFLSYMQDSSSGLVDTLSEVNTLSMLGGGVGIGVDIRSADDKSVGVMPHLKIYDASCLAYRQGKTRRGSYAAYLRIDHPDVLMFLEMRKPTGDQNIKCLNLHHGIIVTDKFMNIIEQCMIDPDFDDTWQLYDKHDTNRVRENVSAKELWQKILDLRMQTGEPYILFIDTANEQMPEFQKNLGLRIQQSNICCLVGESVLELSCDPSEELSFFENIESVVEKYNLGYYDNLYVKSFNTETKEIEWNLVNGAKISGEVEELYEIETPLGNIIECTPEHLIWTVNRGYIMAKDLEETDELRELDYYEYFVENS